MRQNQRPFQGGWGEPSEPQMMSTQLAASAAQRFWAAVFDTGLAWMAALVFTLCAAANHPGMDTTGGMLLVAWLIYMGDTVVMQGLTGLTVGRIVTNTKLVATGTADPPGVATTAIRYLLDLLLAVITLGIIEIVNTAWIVSQRRQQTMVDFWTNVAVVRLP